MDARTDDRPADREAPGTSAPLAGLLNFPSPLIVVSSDGQTVLPNEAVHREFGPVRLGRATVDALLQMKTGPTTLTLESAQGEHTTLVAALCTAVDQWKVLLLGHLVDESPYAELQRLRHSVTSLEQEASTDHLTGAWNRAHFDRTIETEVALAQRSRQPIALVLCDVDHFKRVNDTFGHATGDEVLRQLVRVMKASVRSTDEVFRWGGEEFAVLLRDAGVRTGSRVAQMIRLTLQEHRFDEVGQVTLSAAVAEHCEGESPRKWFARLDEALYRAKANGRNRVEVDQTGGLGAPQLGPALRLAWLDRYECGDATIDTQHRELFELANELLDEALRNGPGLLPLLEQVVRHVETHFADEERILAERGYPGLVWHKRAHTRLLSQAEALLGRVKDGSSQFGELTQFLIAEVVARHLLQEDRGFASLFADVPAATSAPER